MRRLLMALALTLLSTPALAQFDGGPDVRPHSARQWSNRQTWGAAYYSGTNTQKTYDPGVTFVALDSMSITIPPSPISRTFVVNAYWVGTTGFSTTHGVRNAIFMDSTQQGTTNGQGWAPSVSGENPFMTLGPQLVTVPGDSAAHTITLDVADSGATGNLTFQQRWISAVQATQ